MIVQSDMQALGRSAVVWRDFGHVPARDRAVGPDPLDVVRGIVIGFPIAAIMWVAAGLLLSLS